ncbi:MAG: methyltransferase domain-containing protein [Hyphomicrobium sp.]
MKWLNQDLLAFPFTGERYVPGRTSRRIANDHVERYAFAKTFVEGQRVLDIACGVGYGSFMCLEGGANAVDGVDVCIETVNFAARSHVHPNLRFIVGNIATYTVTTPYDVILCFETIEHLADYDAALRNLWMLLRPGGMLLISSPNRFLTSPLTCSFRDTPRNQFHVHEFSVEEMQSILATHGFVVTAGGLYGQRLQWTIQNRVLRSAYEKLFATKWTASARVAPVIHKTPRYFIFVASKPEEKTQCPHR